MYLVYHLSRMVRRTSSHLLFLLLTITLVASGCSGNGDSGDGNDGEGQSEAGTDAITNTLNTTDATNMANTASGELTNVTFGLDWTPNTNHTGVYVAKEQGLYQERGLNVEIMQAAQGGTVEQLVAAGRLDFGVSFQENLTHARLEGLPIVSIAAVIQHNTSGFASRVEDNITSPKDFEGKKYGSFGTQMEESILQEIMQCANADFSKIRFVDVGDTDFFVATERDDVDFMWIYRGWTAVEAQVRGVPLNIVMINDLNCVPDFYTPILITSQETIQNRPELVRQFLEATSLGYTFAINNPEEAANVLINAAPELDPQLVKLSQEYLANEYQAEAPRWGQQSEVVWRTFTEWMLEEGQISEMMDVQKAFTNDFLPPQNVAQP
jgi:ABC-type nitrate/sulfonate/bicarbonate transport system substrate-binding protein